MRRGPYLASFLYSSRYFSLERHYAAMSSGLTRRLRRDDIMQVMFQRPFQHKPLGLPVLLGHRDEFLIKLRIDFQSDLDGTRLEQLSGRF
jgi:hypothetical protein